MNQPDYFDQKGEAGCCVSYAIGEMGVWLLLEADK
jgi:hypothetical protein